MISLERFEEDVGELREKISSLRESKCEGWQEKAVKLIRQSRLEDLHLEMKRIRSVNLLGADFDRLTDFLKLCLNSPNDREKVMLLVVNLARAMEIRAIYASTHHVFIHAQSSQWMVVPLLIREIMRMRSVGEKVRQFKYLRMPSDDDRVKKITDYSTKNDVCDHEPQARKNLLSVNHDFLDSTPGESAICWAYGNRNASSFFEEMVAEIIRHYFSEDFAIRYAPRIVKLTENDPSAIGNLFVLCVPKERSAEVQYRAHAFGSPCRCHKNASPENPEKCEDGNPPQFRIFTPALRPGVVKIYSLVSHRDHYQKMKAETQVIVKEMKASVKEKKASKGFLGSSCALC